MCRLCVFHFSVGGKLLYNVVLISGIWQCESVIILYIFPSSWASLPSLHPTPQVHHRAPSKLLVLIQQLSTILYLVAMAPHSSTLAWKIPWMEDTTEWLHFHFSLPCVGEGNGNLLQCSCLENPRDGGAWWAAVSGVAQSRTRLKRLSSSSSSSIYMSMLLSQFSPPSPSPPVSASLLY